MQDGEAPGPGSVKSRKPRRVAAVGAAGDQARRLQELGDTLNDTVRAVRTRDQLTEGLSRRVHELWMAERAQLFEWHPTELRAGGKLVLAASAQSGRFILPAFSAGLRALVLREQSTPADIVLLAERLGQLEAGEISLQAFASFLFCGGALGFDVAQEESVFELGAGLIAEVAEAELWSERSQQAVELWNELAWKAAQALDGRTLAERFGAPLEQLHQRMQRGELTGLAADELAALRDAAADPAGFGKLEIQLMLQCPPLRGSVSTAHLSFRLASVIEGSPTLDPRLPELCAHLGGLHGARQLEPQILGAALGRRLLGRGLESAMLLQLAASVGPELVSGLLGHLNEREDCGAAAQPMLRALLQHGGMRGVLARIDPTQLQPALAGALMGAAFEARVPSAELAHVLARLPAQSALSVLTAVPVLLRVAQPVLEAMILDRATGLEPLLPAFVRGSTEAARCAGAALQSTRCKGFTQDGLETILSAFVEIGLGSDFVLPLWMSNDSSIAVRLAALSAMERSPKLLADAMRRRGDVSEPPPIRVALEELRWRQPT